MKLLHMADLHLGKIVNGFSMIEDQKYILNQIVSILDKERPNGILMSGDIYDRSIPSAEAVALFNSFLEKIADKNIPAFIISGNHDSSERLSFAHKILDASGIHFSPVYHGETVHFTLGIGQDDETNIFLLPFIKPSQVRAQYPDEEISSYTDAIGVAIDHMEIPEEKINILLAHQFVTGAERCESEEISVGGLDNVDVSVFRPFDYVALGHIHGPQMVARETVRYAGSPLKYSFSEVHHKKSVTMIDIQDKNHVEVHLLPLEAKRDMAEVRGTYAALMEKSAYEGTTLQEDYVRITLTDEEDVPDALARLRTVYHNLMELKYDNARTRSNGTLQQLGTIEKLTPQDLFKEFYKQQNGQTMTEKQEKVIDQLVYKIWEGESCVH